MSNKYHFENIVSLCNVLSALVQDFSPLIMSFTIDLNATRSVAALPAYKIEHTFHPCVSFKSNKAVYPGSLS